MSEKRGLIITMHFNFVSSYMPELYKLLFVCINEIPQVLIFRFHKKVEAHIHTSLFCYTLVVVLVSHARILLDKDSV